MDLLSVFGGLLHRNEWSSISGILTIEHNRKNWLFSVSTDGADASATVYSIIQTAKANNLDPCKYLTYIFKHLPGHDTNKQSNIDFFLPWNEEIQKECKL